MPPRGQECSVENPVLAIERQFVPGAWRLIVVPLLSPDAFEQPRELLLAPLLLMGPAFVLLLAAIAIIRRCGYRLRSSFRQQE